MHIPCMHHAYTMHTCAWHVPWQEGAVQLLLCSLYGSRWHASDEQAFLSLAETLCHGLRGGGDGGEPTNRRVSVEQQQAQLLRL